jgi:4,5-dihydroxyphthalate decarboxylase
MLSERCAVSNLRITLACWNYDRTRALLEQRVRPEGVDLTCLNLPVEETFFRMLRHQEFDAAEMSLSSYVMSLFRPDRPFIAIPAFPSRFFRHSCVYVHAGSGIKEPKDLVGKRIGTPEYQMTAGVWIRGILSEDYGVPASSVVYVTGGEEEPGRPEKLPLELPPGIRIEPIGPHETLSSMLARGGIDGLYTARTPSSFRSGDGQVKRLFEDFPAVERSYFRRTGIFPIMHTVVIRRDVYERDRWVAQSLYKAFCAALRDSYAELFETAALKTMLPWLPGHVEETRREMGDDFWPYGLERNSRTLETFLRYSFEQGLAREVLQPERLFAPETLESFRI